MSTFCVIGSGISGATIANLLSQKTFRLIYLTKQEDLGGRVFFQKISIKSKGFDHGAQYISPKSPSF